MLHAAYSILHEAEKDSKPLAQEQFNQLYDEIYHFMKKAHEKAQSQSKPSLFVIGEMHPTLIGKSSLVIEAIAMYVAKELGIKSLFLESTIEILQERKERVANLQLAKEKYKWTEEEYLYHCNEIGITDHLVNQTIIKSFKLIPSEKTRQPLAEYKDKEQSMCNTLISHKSSGLLAVGLFHLPGIYQHKILQKNYSVHLINSVNPKFVSSFLEEAAAPGTIMGERPDYIDFIKNSKKIKRFYLSGLSAFTPHQVINMVQEAHKQFWAMQISNEQLKTLKPELPIPMYHSTQTQFMNFEKLSANSSQQSISDGRTVPHAVAQYPLESVPIHLLIQIGFFLLHKTGKCSKPVYNTANIIYKDAFLEKFAKTQQEEAAAESKLNQEGSSLEAALVYFFNTQYIKGYEQDKLQQKKFLVDMINGNVKKDIYQEFNKLVMIENPTERSKRITQLMHKSAQPQTDFSFAMQL